ncbi:MAG: four helix bundle protein [Bacteroidetes bacterium]|nr:four helix bundle protein [Bacteroidota bacterium]
MPIQRFEEMKVWQDSRKLSQQIYSITKSKDFIRDFGLRDQIQRASVSVMSNIAEGYERDSNRELIRFLNYSKGSVGEIRSLLYVAFDQEYITKDQFNELKDAATVISIQVANFIKYLQKRVAAQK